MEKRIAILAGDGIGPEVMAGAIEVLNTIGVRFGHRFQFEEGKIGGAAFDAYQTHFPDETRKICERADAILFGSVGGPVAAASEPKWKNCEANSILALRKAFQFSVNFRPISILPELSALSPLKGEVLGGGVDFVIIRELVGDIYFGEHKTFERAGIRVATDVAEYTETQIASAGRAAFELARSRKNRVTSVDKANVLDTSKLWRVVMNELSREYPDVQLEHMLVDNCAMQLVKAPTQFDVIVTSNMFGDILSDTAAVLPGSLGLLASASLNAEGFGLYEPPGGSAPDIAGKNIANPIGQIRAAAFMLKVSFNMDDESAAIENSIQRVLRSGVRTKDIAEENGKSVTTTQMVQEIVQHL